MDVLRKRLLVNFLGYAHWFMSIIIYQIKDHSISVDQYIYATSIVAKYLDTDAVQKSTNFYKNNFPSDMIFTNENHKVERSCCLIYGRSHYGLKWIYDRKVSSANNVRFCARAFSGN